MSDSALELIEDQLSDIVILRKMEFEMEKLKLEVEDRERERQFQQLRLQSGVPEGPSPSFDISKNTRLVPIFDELDPEGYFMQFEKLANTLSWPRQYWSTPVQVSLVGKADLHLLLYQKIRAKIMILLRHQL